MSTQHQSQQHQSQQHQPPMPTTNSRLSSAQSGRNASNHFRSGSSTPITSSTPGTPEPNSDHQTSRNIPANSSFKELKKTYNMKKKFFAKNIQNAIDSTQEVHSGWLKARTTFKRWTKVWCQVKPGYLIMYTSQEAQKKHRLGVILLSVCQVITRPTKKEGFCFKLINPFGCSVWAKSSTRALAFAQAGLTLRVSDAPIGKIWLDALHQCHLSSNLDGYQPVIDEAFEAREGDLRSELSESDDGNSTRQLDSLMFSHIKGASNSNSVSSLNNCQGPTGKAFINGHSLVSQNPAKGAVNSRRLDENANNPSAKGQAGARYQDGTTSHVGKNNRLNNDTTNGTGSNFRSTSDYALASAHLSNQDDAFTNSNTSKMVAKFSKYNWRELQLECVNYTGDGAEELGSAGIQSEEVHDSNKNFLWHIIKQLRPGMDLSKVTLPTFILEPRSFLEKLADYYYHCDILSEAVVIDDPTLRLINIVKWYLSGFYKKPKGPKKPYNPILGEKFRCFWDHPKTQSRTFFIAEQVSHHPPISAFHVSNRKDGYTITCALLSRSKFGGNSVSAILDGRAKLHLSKRNETYTLTMPYANCRGILLGSLCMELGGKVEIGCAETGCKCELDFKLAPVWASSNSYNALAGKILKDNKVTHTLEGHWDKKITIVDKQSNEKSVMWEVTDAVRSSRLKRYAVAIDDQGERESVRLWSKVTEALAANDQTVATAEKTRLEDMQRQEARERRTTFVPEHFRLSPDTNEWNYRWQDDRMWNDRRDILQFEDNFKIRTLMLTSGQPSGGSPISQSFNPTIDLPLTQLSKLSDRIGAPVGEVMRPSVTKNEPIRLDREDPYKTIESRIDSENRLIKRAIEQVNEKNRKLEEDLATLKRGKRLAAFVMAAIIVAILSAYFKYYP